MKKIGVILLLLVYLVNLSIACFGIGIAPANKELIFEPNKDYTIVYRIYNSEAENFIATISINGSLNQYITLIENYVEFTEQDKFKTFTIKIKTPESINSEIFGDINIHAKNSDIHAKIKIVDSNQNNNIINMGGEEVANKINNNKNEPPTGNVVKDDSTKQNSNLGNNENSTLSKYLLPALLILIIAGNVIFLLSGKLKRKKQEKASNEKSKTDFEKKTDNINYNKQNNSLKPQYTNNQVQINQNYQNQMIPNSAYSNQIQPNQNNQNSNNNSTISNHTNQNSNNQINSISNKVNINEFIDTLKQIDDRTFFEYVNAEKNEFADYLEDNGMPELALILYNINNRNDMIYAVEKYIYNQRNNQINIKEKSPEEIKREIMDLKSEFDNFNFNN